jgi:hypothetical protein
MRDANFLKSGFYSFVGNLFGKFISIPVGIYVIGRVGPDGYGKFGIITILIQYLGLLNLGILSNMSREIPMAYGRQDLDEVKKIYSTIYTNYSLTTLLSLIVTWLIYFSGLFYPNQISVIYFITISLILLSSNTESFLYSMIKAEGDFLAFGQYELATKVSVPFLNLFFVYFFAELGLLYSIIGTSLIAFIILIGKVRTVDLFFCFDYVRTKKLLSTSILMYINKIIDLLFISITSLLAARYLNLSDVGVLTFALSVVAVSKLPFANIYIINFEREIGLHGGRKGLNFINFRPFYGSKFLTAYLFLLIALGGLVIFYSVVIKNYLNEYQDSLPVLYLLFFGLAFYNGRYLMTSFINVTKQMYKRSFILIIGAVFNLLFGYLSIRLGYELKGLVLVLLISMVVISMYTFIFVFRQVFDSKSFALSYSLRLFFTTLISSIVLYQICDKFEYNYSGSRLSVIMYSFLEVGFKFFIFSLITVVSSLLFYRDLDVWGYLKSSFTKTINIRKYF